MEKLLIILPFILVSGILIAQDDLYYSPKMKATQADTILYKTDIVKVQYCLGNYYQQRQTGLIMSLLGASISTVSIFAINNSEKAKEIASVVGGLIGVTGFIITIDAEKWLKRASISISPTSLKIKF